MPGIVLDAEDTAEPKIDRGARPQAENILERRNSKQISGVYGMHQVVLSAKGQIKQEGTDRVFQEAGRRVVHRASPGRPC